MFRLFLLLKDYNEKKRKSILNDLFECSGLAEAAYEHAAENVSDGGQPETYCLSSFFQYIVERLLETTDRTDGAQVAIHNTFIR